MPFDRVIFNFPHSGEQRVHSNRALLRAFFASAAGVVAPAGRGGEVHVTLNAHGHYKSWGVEGCARDAGAGLHLLRVAPFDAAAFPGYRHVTTLKGAHRSHAESSSDAKTFVFVKLPEGAI